MELHSLGESVWLIYLPEEAEAVQLSAHIREIAPNWLQDVVPAYSSVGVYFDADRIRSVEVAEWLLLECHHHSRPALQSENARTIHIPVCYERGPDLAAVSTLLNLTPEAIIELHSTTMYTVHAIGFVPGFPYLGYLPPELCSVPRMASPRTRVEPGSVGLTGRQTGLYPLARPGGWHLIGQTPLILVDVAAGFFPLRVGDRISFTRIDEVEYHQQHGQRVCRPV